MTFSSFYVENKRLCAEWDLKQKRKVFYSCLKTISPGIAMAALALAPSTAFSESFYENGSRAKAKTAQFSVLGQPKNLSGPETYFKLSERRIRGVVADEAGEGLPGVNVVIKGTNTGTSTDVSGKFDLLIPDNQSVLVFSFVGYVTQEVQITSQSELAVTLPADNRSLNEVMVVGYGTQKKSDITGAISRLGEEQIRERPVQNVVQALQGKASGVDITTNQRPGEVGRIRIRGNRSINASNEPLYVIDGIPLSASEVTAINPNDIASIEVLKDASATAIYGSRGANGVILITYKEGKKGKTSINYDVSYASGKIHSTTDWMNAGELLNWQRQSHING